MKRLATAAAAALLLALFAPLSAHAVGKPYVTFGLGAWRGKFHQEGFSQTSPTTYTTVGPALLIQTGIDFSVLSIEYNISWLASEGLGFGSDSRPRSNQGTYYSLLGLTVGFEPIPVIRPHIGVERGNFGFATGSAPDYSGTTLKAGIDLIFPVQGRALFGLTAEVSKLFVTSDDAGAMPSGISTNVLTYMLGLKVGAGGAR